MTLELFSSKEIREIADRFVSTDYCQIRTITSELLHNFNEWILLNPDNLKGIDKYYFIESITDLIGEIRSCHPFDNHELSQLLTLPPEEFTTKANQLSVENKKEIQYFYDNFWQHNNIFTLFNQGKIKDYTAFKIISIEEVETLANLYLDNKFFKSNTLEYLIIDSLLFAETIEFVNNKCNLPVQKTWNLVVNFFEIVFKFLLKEGISLFITAIVASAIDSSQGTNYWIAFATITIIRWLNPNKLEKMKFRGLLVSIFFEMMVFYDAKFKHSEFNTKLIQEMLFNLERKGASYSHWVYHILDRRLIE